MCNSDTSPAVTSYYANVFTAVLLECYVMTLEDEQQTFRAAAADQSCIGDTVRSKLPAPQ